VAATAPTLGLPGCEPAHSGVLSRPHISLDMGAPCVLGLLGSHRPCSTVDTIAATRLTGLSSLTRDEIEAILPHRDPFLLLDEVVDLEPGERVVALKRVRPDEWYLSGHFPGRPIMPGVLIVEAMAQAGAVAVLSEEENRGKLALFAGIDGVRFKRVVEPGDELEITCELERVRGPIGRGKATAKVDGQLAARGTLTFAVEQ
jgi:3-hydroxyacyl-[acyl-carrier-protein] dehydratase